MRQVGIGIDVLVHMQKSQKGRTPLFFNWLSLSLPGYPAAEVLQVRPKSPQTHRSLQ